MPIDAGSTGAMGTGYWPHRQVSDSRRETEVGYSRGYFGTSVVAPVTTACCTGGAAGSSRHCRNVSNRVDYFLTARTSPSALDMRLIGMCRDRVYVR